MSKTKVLTYVFLYKRIDGGVGANSTRNGAKGHVFTSVNKAIKIATQFPSPATKLHAKSHGLSMDAVCASNTKRIALFKGAAKANLAKATAVLNKKIGCLNQLIAQSRVARSELVMPK